jgi:hypothetical protein
VQSFDVSHSLVYTHCFVVGGHDGGILSDNLFYILLMFYAVLSKLNDNGVFSGVYIREILFVYAVERHYIVRRSNQ